MKKIYTPFHFPPGKWRKPLLVMKIKLFLLLCCAGSLSAAPSWSQQVKLNVSFANKTIVEALNDLKAQTGYQFFYQKGLIRQDQRASVSLKEASLEQVLDNLLAANGYQYEIQDKVVLISRAAAAAATQQASRTILIKGKVTDAEGNAVPGATVVVENTHTGVATDADGTFTIPVRTATGNLVVSHLGFEKKTVKFTEGQTLAVVLKTATAAVDDVVITGYTVMDKRISASAVTSVKMDDIRMAGVNTVDKMLQGQIPGLMVMNSSGSPNATPRMRIRGSSTIYGNAAPIWVVDGIIREDPTQLSNDELNNILSGTPQVMADQLNQNSSLSLLGNAIAGLNPNDIESLTFLKDASATAIYGTRAANGVIVVTTKRGEIGKPSVSFSGSFGFTARPRYQDYQLMNSKQRVGLSKEVAENGYIYESMPYRTAYEGALFDFYDKLITKDQFDRRVATLETMNTDWFDLLFRDAFSQDYNVSVSGGTLSNRYYVSAGYGDSRGAAKGDDQTRYNLNMNMTTRFGEAVHVDWRLSYSNRKAEGFYTVNPMDYALKTSRAISPDEYYTTYTTTMTAVGSNFPLSYNILNELANTGNEIIGRQMKASVSLTARITRGLQFQGSFATDYSNTQNRQWAAERSYYIATIRGYDFGAVEPRSAEEYASPLPKGGILLYNNTDQASYAARGQFNYNKMAGRDHVFNVSLGAEMQSNEYKGLRTTEWGYYPDRGHAISYEYDTKTSGYNGVGTAYYSSLEKHTVGNINTISNTIGLYGIMAYSFKNRYVLNANIRSDASNRFGQYTNNRFQPVWSVAGAWNIDQEAWFAGSKWVQELKLRASYGFQGSVPTSVGPNLIVKYPSTLVNRFTGEYQLNVSRYPYPDLRWEKTQTVNLGLDFAVLDNRIRGTLDYYVKNGRDVIFELDVPAEYGVDGIYRNGANIQNTGIELALSFVPVQTRDFKWVVSTVFSKNTNKAGQTGRDDNEYTYSAYIAGNAFRDGKAVGGLYAWRFTGLNPDTGIATFADTAPYGETVEQSDDPTTYLEYCGQRDPKFNGGFSTSVYYRNFSVNASFAFAFGHVKRLNPLFGGALKMPSPQDNLGTELLGRWKKPGDQKTTTVPGFVYDGNSGSYLLQTPIGSMNSYELYNYSTARIVDGDFFRCRNLSLSYYFGREVLSHLGAGTMACSFGVSNPFTLCSKKFNGQDPEIDNTGGTALPITRNYTLSFSISF